MARGPYDAALVFQIPETALALGPLLKTRKTPLYLWYAHRATPAALRAALPFTRQVFTSHKNALRLPTRKRVVIGQGIDTDRFSPGREGPSDPATIVCVGRISPIKNPQALIQAARHLGERCRFRFIGDPLGSRDKAYFDRIKARAGPTVRFDRAIPPDRMPELYRTATATVNLAPTGALDKAALEAMACAVPTLACNESFRDILPSSLRFRAGDAKDLASKLKDVLEMSGPQRKKLGGTLRDVIVKHHGLERFMDAVVRTIGKANA
jgi:glycosyltransferase involved in cell wall biosynthesis